MFTASCAATNRLTFRCRRQPNSKRSSTSKPRGRSVSAQGAKGAVAADGPENPERVQLNKAVAGWLSHSGFAHGGNGYEGIAFLVEQFAGTGLADPANPAHGLDLEALAAKCAAAYAKYRTDKQSAG